MLSHYWRWWSTLLVSGLKHVFQLYFFVWSQTSQVINDKQTTKNINKHLQVSKAASSNSKSTVVGGFMAKSSSGRTSSGAMPRGPASAQITIDLRSPRMFSTLDSDFNVLQLVAIPVFVRKLCIYIYMCVYIYTIHTHTHIYIYIYISICT